MNRQALLTYTRMLIFAHRREGTEESLFIARRLEDVIGLIELTGASSEQEYTDRIEQNQAWVKEAEYLRGYDDARDRFAASYPAEAHLN